MARNRKPKRTAKKPAPDIKRRGRYTAGEWFVAILGGALLVLFLGIVITAVLGE